MFRVVFQGADLWNNIPDPLSYISIYSIRHSFQFVVEQ